MLVHGMTLLSFRLFRTNLGNLREFFGQMVHRPPGKKIARSPMDLSHSFYYYCVEEYRWLYRGLRYIYTEVRYTGFSTSVYCLLS